MRHDLLHLATRCRQLRDRFIPPYDATGTYTPEQYDGVLAFGLLVHAEIEAFLESQALRVATACESNWKLDRRPRTTIAGLLAYASSGSSRPPERVTPRRTDMMDRVNLAKGEHATTINNNNGLKEKNLLAMLLPIGVRETEMPADLIRDLDTFGGLRGEYAHKSAAVQTLPDPRDVVQMVARILSKLRPVLTRLEELEAE